MKQRGKRGRFVAVGESRCSLPGCDHIGRGGTAPICEMHYYRKRRTGSYDLSPKQLETRIPHSHGYVLLLAKGHPLTDKSGRGYEHRIVYYNAHGEGPFLCHWCEKEVTWKTLHIDHLDDNKTNNSEANLVASCSRCNQQRGKHKMIAKNSTWLTLGGTTLTCKQWAERVGISRSALHVRLRKGWPLGRALTEPRGKFGPHTRNTSYNELKAGA